jgi:tetratricopeptide (TPR) repeat protein
MDPNPDLLRRGRFRDWCDLAEHAIGSAGAVGHPYRASERDPAAEADALHELGRWQWHAGRFSASARSLARALTLRGRLFGENDARTLDTRERMAALHHHLGRADAAERFEAVLAMREPGTLAEAVTYRNWGAALRDRDDGRAHEVLSDACSRIERVAGREHPEYAAALKAHAFCVLRDDARGHVAIELAAQAHSACLRCHDNDHPFTASALLLIARAELRETTVFGSVHHRRATAARRHLDEVAAIYERAYEATHPMLAIVWMVRSDCASADGDLEGALAARERAFAIYAQTYAEGPWLAGMMLEVARVHLRRGDLEAAMEWIRRAAPNVTTWVEYRRPELVEQCARLAESQGDEALARALRPYAAELEREGGE